MPDGYAKNWPETSERIKAAAGWKCERCGVAHETRCPYCSGQGTLRDSVRPTRLHPCGYCQGKGQRGRVLTVHHLDGDKANDAAWNLAALCQRCHLKIQAKVDFRQGFLFEHSDWFRPHYESWLAAQRKEEPPHA